MKVQKQQNNFEVKKKSKDDMIVFNIKMMTY